MSKWRIIVMVILGLTALSKFWSLFHPSPLLFQLDPILGVQLVYIVGIACFLECCVGVWVWRAHDDTAAAWGTFAFAAVILSYRAVASASDASYCPCLGNVVVWWPWLARYEGPVLATIACWLFLTSALQLTWSEPRA